MTPHRQYIFTVCLSWKRLKKVFSEVNCHERTEVYNTYISLHNLDQIQSLIMDIFWTSTDRAPFFSLPSMFTWTLKRHECIARALLQVLTDRQHNEATWFVQLIGRITPNTPIRASVPCYLLRVALVWRHRQPAVPVPTGSLPEGHHCSALDKDPPAPCVLLLLPILPIPPCTSLVGELSMAKWTPSNSGI